MPKKLLMNNYSENGLMPVMDGLICWLDGRDAWEGKTVFDRMKNVNFLLDGIYTNPFILNNQHKIYSEKMFNLYSNFTICLAVNISSIYEYGILLSDERPIGTSSNYFKICHRNNGRIGVYYSAISPINKGVPINFNNKIIITVVCKEGVISIYDYNKVSQSDSLNKVSINRSLQIGGRYTGLDIAVFELYSLKIYNRALTEEEVKQNYLYEQLIERG